MAYLLNRVPASRIECLYSLLQTLYNKYGVGTTFTITDTKYADNDENVKHYCKLLNDYSGFLYCPYLDNPLDARGCNLTNAKDNDSTKSKEASNTINALHALGLLYRNGNTLQVTKAGKTFATTQYGTAKMQKLIEEAVLRYGLVVGVLAQIQSLVQVGNTFRDSEVYVGYPTTEEQVKYNGHLVRLSAGSTQDSNTRTKTCVLSWLTTAGYIHPVNWEEPKKNEYPHYKYRDKLNSGHRSESRYILVKEYNFSDLHHITERPLDYSNMTKLTSALRERDSEETRNVTLANEHKIQNRRFAICYMLNNAFCQGNSIKFSQIVSFLQSHEDLFVISDQDMSSIVESELPIANMAGIPYKIIGKNTNLAVKPLAGIDITEMSQTRVKKDAENVKHLLDVLNKEIH